MQQVLRSGDPFQHYPWYQEFSLHLPDFCPVRHMAAALLIWKTVPESCRGHFPYHPSICRGFSG